ncbi:ABC1 kinase family protein [Dactylosporangium sp. NPDC051541]|uniref:ABC1 kinase family protein n=1 Tax=Dactylosporangium sp. NPDC051541 TaxID=3363977 RepID=UPI0037A5E55F
MANVSFAVFGTIVTILLLLLIVVGARRLLGLRIGLLRTVAGCAVALLTTGVVTRSTGGVEANPALLTVVIGAALLVTMAFLMLAELLVPHGSSPITWLRALRRWLARTRRYSQIAGIGVRHGLGPYLRGRGRRRPGSTAIRARHLRLALEESGVTFIKLGQVLSTRRDLLPPEFIAELSQLQHEVPPAPWPAIRAVLIDELGTEPDTIFASFDEEPIAAASIAQVHRATLRSGAEVVVKVQRPGLRPLVERDLDILATLARGLHERMAWARAIGINDLAQGFADALTEELDFRVEAANTTAVRTLAMARKSPVVIPEIHTDLSTPRVLVMEKLPGVPLGTRSSQHEAGAGQLLSLMLEQIMIDGIFHCDPHPGNVFVLDDGRLALLDFGVVGRIDANIQAALQDLLVAIDRRDRAGLSDALLEAVARPEGLDEQALERALGQFMASHLAAGVPPRLDMFIDLFRILGAHGLRVPPGVAAVFRAVATLEGTLKALAPDFEIIEAARTFATGRITSRFSPPSLRQAAEDEALKLLPLLRRLPRRVDRITNALEQGRLTFATRLFADERDRTYITGLVRQLTLAFLGAVTGVMAVLLLGTTGGPGLSASLTLYQLFGYNLLLLSAVLMLRALVTALRR